MYLPGTTNPIRYLLTNHYSIFHEEVIYSGYCLCSSLFTMKAADKTELVDYVNPGRLPVENILVHRKYLSGDCNAVGYEFLDASNRKDGRRLAYIPMMPTRYGGFKQTHQPSPWINDYGQFAIMPITGKVVFDQDKRASWFSHKAEVAKPNYYRVYLADHDVVTEITPTERAAMFRFYFSRNG